MSDRPNPVTEFLRRQRVSHTESDLERLRRLRENANLETRTLIDTLISAIQSLQTRIEVLEHRQTESSESFLDIQSSSGSATPVPESSPRHSAHYPVFR
jgi:hypothetical protein